MGLSDLQNQDLRITTLCAFADFANNDDWGQTICESELEKLRRHRQKNERNSLVKPFNFEVESTLSDFLLYILQAFDSGQWTHLFIAHLNLLKHAIVAIIRSSFCMNYLAAAKSRKEEKGSVNRGFVHSWDVSHISWAPWQQVRILARFWQRWAPN